MPSQRGSRRWPSVLLLALAAGMAGLVALAVSGFHLFAPNQPVAATTPSQARTPGSDAAFSYLAAEHSNFCSLSRER